MKILLKITSAVVLCAILALAVCSVTGLDPRQRTPGLWLKGDVQGFPSDWTFADQYRTIMVETHPWYLIPHSVNIYFVTDRGNLYLHADYEPGGKYPDGKPWTSYVGRNPHVRVKLGNRVFDGKVALVSDPTDDSRLFEDFRKKYPRSPFSDYRRKPDVDFLHVIPD